MEVRLRHNLDLTWFRIAVEHERTALDARSRGAIDDEMRAAMVAVVSSAFAIDAMGAKIAELLGPATPHVEGRIGLLVETYKVGLDLGPRTQAWQAAIKKLFKMRGRSPTTSARTRRALRIPRARRTPQAWRPGAPQRPPPRP
jgi:hypothetical protein